MTPPNIESFDEIIRSFAGRKVLIVGDLMLDEYISGQVKRISPEAPVPVVLAKSRRLIPGGAANVAMNVRALGGTAVVAGVIGHDGAGADLMALLASESIDTSQIVNQEGRPTTMKCRIVGHNQQIVRIDWESVDTISQESVTALQAGLAQVIADADAVVISDYAKGVISPELSEWVLCEAAKRGKPTVVDPKGTDYAKYRGATVTTPNAAEAELASKISIERDTGLLEAAAELGQMLPGTSLLITQGSEGMSLFQPNTQPMHIPTVAKNVFDVTGAGDTVVGTLALALAAGAGMADASALANAAAGVVVGKLGTATANVEELRDFLRSQ